MMSPYVDRILRTYVMEKKRTFSTQCNRSDPVNFLCEEVGKVICEGIIHVHMNVYVHVFQLTIIMCSAINYES